MAKQKDDVEVQDEVSPGEYFKRLKGKRQKVTDEVLTGIYDNCATLMDKYSRTIEKERKVIAKGIDTFVYLEDVQRFVEGVQGRVVKIIELERYEREIPDDVVEAYEKVKDLFSKFVVVFTDYTKEHEKKAKKERDPILFGMFQDKNVEANGFISSATGRNCDLTLDKLVVEMKKETKNDVEFKLRDPLNLDEVREKIKALEAEQNKGRVNNGNTLYVVNGEDKPENVPKKPVFARIKTFLGIK